MTGSLNKHSSTNWGLSNVLIETLDRRPSQVNDNSIIKYRFNKKPMLSLTLVLLTYISTIFDLINHNLGFCCLINCHIRPLTKLQVTEISIYGNILLLSNIGDMLW